MACPWLGWRNFLTRPLMAGYVWAYPSSPRWSRGLVRSLRRQWDQLMARSGRRWAGLERIYAQGWGRAGRRWLGRRLYHAHPAHALLAFSLVGGASSNFDWHTSSLTPETLREHCRDLDYIQRLIRQTLTCAHCGQRHRLEQPLPGHAYCHCPHQVASVYGQSLHPDIPWTPFLERPNILVWRMEQPPGSGLYAYKMYGHFDDVTADELVEVQLDMSEFRLSWDQNTAQCHVVEECVDQTHQTLSQIYYWEVNWPSFFANRDYVCQRRTQIFQDENMAVILSRSTDHPNYPKKAKAHRVQDYNSVLTIKPVKAFDEKGVEFSLTAFEDPGVSLPGSITTWVAIRGMPDYMNNLREACLKLRQRKLHKSDPSGRTDAAVQLLSSAS
ncbi:hypothetical protein TCAL_10131 [Tigriopus californicus]|uniref:Phosphatidylcholine transfer protein n=1 Tax=Tigriopus californicus TaxID=6832 RepID=A0A553P1Z7_TIGCA|nr:phosphatidylcholine transfer protein-like [Tigriopus californicus]TRY71711.1 hypothetical protein TCAL_10131 [Tigriopus californicus]|eukprot:TCALIF_10131-PA protein Name:"Similar to STARD7 StAR-related lipid transfer protein 7, mitochondrial (Homo sapiens)" AED:0.06 eAED:0.06 QI:0/-1/0/1/-1/1/1/0/384